MNSVAGNDKSFLFGSASLVAADRGLTELRSGRPVVFDAPAGALLVLPVEGLDDSRLAEFRALCAPSSPRLLLSSPRARAIGIETADVVSLTLADDASVETIMALVFGRHEPRPIAAESSSDVAASALDLIKLAQGLPAALMTPLDRIGSLEAFNSVRVPAAAVAAYRRHLVDSLIIASDARVPLASNGHTRFVIFRDGAGNNSVAVVIGEPDLSRPVPVRLHSACLTGDVFGSRRCDCGDQLRLALDQLDADGGVILYLPQEGRGLGIANKMRAYSLQDAGFDTIDANTRLGFDEDERDYASGARMLQLLGIDRVWLMTNNPAKLTGLAAAGIEVIGRLPLEAPVNADNRRYLAAKAMRAGHQLDNFVATLAEAAPTD